MAGLSAARLHPFFTAARGNVRDALKLYQWNIDLSGAMYESLHLFEVVLRNSMDAQLCAWNATQRDRRSSRQHSPDWLMDPSHLLARLTGTDIPKATSRARKALRSGQHNGRVPGHADVLAQVSLGTWRFLLPDRDPGKRRLWDDALVKAFPHLHGPRRDLVRKIDDVYRIRNRVAHLEPLLSSATARDRLNAMRQVLGAIEPATEQLFTSRQRVTSTLRARPL